MKNFLEWSFRMKNTFILMFGAQKSLHIAIQVLIRMSYIVFGFKIYFLN